MSKTKTNGTKPPTGSSAAATLYTITEAADEIGVVHTAITNAINRGAIAAVHTAGGTLRLIHRSEVERYKNRPAGGPGRPRSS